jgi:hypothetical protein
MSNLQLGLAMLGGVILAAVVAYNAWITRKAPRKTDAAPRTAEPQPVQGFWLHTQLLSPCPPRRLPKPNRGKRAGPDALIDVVATLAVDGEVSGDAIWRPCRTRRWAASPPPSKRSTASVASGSPGQRYTAVQAGVQLANRHGPLNEIEFSEFVMKAQGLADTLGANPEFPEMRDEVLRARELDQFASTHDAQLGFTLRATRAAWSPGYVQQHAARLGFVAGALPGRMVLPGAEGGSAPVLSLLFDTQAALAEDPEQSALREVSLLLDVAHVPQSEQPYPRMREVASTLAAEMDGVLTDDQGQPLPGAALDRIGADLEAF